MLALGLLVGLPAAAEARLVVRSVAVRGAHKTTSGAIAGRIRLQPGDPVDFTVLAEAERRLIESDLFDHVKVTIDLPREVAVNRMYVDDRVYPVDVEVEVAERLSWFIVPNAGFGSGDYAGGVVYADQNFLGRDVQLFGAGQLGQQKSYVFLAYRDPLLATAAITYSFNGIYRYEQIRFFDDHHLLGWVPTEVYGGEGQIGWVASPHLRAILGGIFRHQTVMAPHVEPGATLPLYNPRSGRMIVLLFQVQYDNTTAPEGIRRGVRLWLKNELSDRYWGSDFDYVKFDTKLELYGHFKHTYPSVIVHWVLDYPTSDHGVPITELVRVGGQNLRGYLVNEFHGDTLFSIQAEDQVLLLRRIRVPFTKARFSLAAAAFLDLGALLERHPGGISSSEPGNAPPESRPKLADFHTSVGAGLRLILPGVVIPALKLDVGYGIDVRSVAFTVSIAGGGL
ncbi:MAG TPA: BamA/TamA family outer membrane protein [Polyangia bacterium]